MYPKTCIGCDTSFVGPKRSILVDLCPACWGTLTAADRCARVEATQMIGILNDLVIRLQHIDMSRIETMQLAKAIEQLSRVTKPQADAWDSIEAELVPLLRSIREERG